MGRMHPFLAMFGWCKVYFTVSWLIDSKMDLQELFADVFDDDEDDIISTVILADDDAWSFASLQMLEGRRQTRGIKWPRKRIVWNDHIQLLLNTNTFQSRCHMSHSAFVDLVELLRSRGAAINVLQSIRSTSGRTTPIVPEMVVGAGLRFLGGEVIKSTADICGISDASTKRIVDKFLDAVNSTLSVDLPTTRNELETCAAEWNDISGAGDIFFGAVGALDGWSLCTEMPSVSHPIDCRSGHCQRCGLSVQAVCDAKLRFRHFGVVAPGKTNDCRAFNRCESLRRWLNSLPQEFFIIGDNAHGLTDKLLVPFSAPLKHNTCDRTHNFHLSQLRIRIEMAFGRLTTKWRIFRRNLDFPAEKNAQIAMAAARLHNCVIDKDNVGFERFASESHEFGVDPFVMEDGTGVNRGCLEILPSRGTAIPEEESRRQHIMMDTIERDLRRPMHNLARNRELDDDSVHHEGDDD